MWFRTALATIMKNVIFPLESLFQSLLRKMSDKLFIKSTISITKCNYQQKEQEIQYYFEINLLLFLILND